MEAIWDRRVVLPLMVTGFFGFYTAVEYARRFIRPWPPLWLFAIARALCLVFTLYRFFTTWPQIRRRQQGILGERIVGQLLEGLRTFGCKVYHDISENGFNIDHVIIGPHGVFAIETKTPSKPARDAVVAFDGETVTIGGFAPDRDPIVQARAVARHVRKILREMSGMDPRVTPVLLYPGWFVEKYTRDTDVIVMNESYFFKAFDNALSRPSVCA
jgi:hypothetical protein